MYSTEMRLLQGGGRLSGDADYLLHWGQVELD